MQMGFVADINKATINVNFNTVSVNGND